MFNSLSVNFVVKLGDKFCNKGLLYRELFDRGLPPFIPLWILGIIVFVSFIMLGLCSIMVYNFPFPTLSFKEVSLTLWSCFTLWNLVLCALKNDGVLYVLLHSVQWFVFAIVLSFVDCCFLPLAVTWYL